MRLSDQDILKALESNDIRITPAPNPEKISGISVDLHLGDRFRTFDSSKATCIDLGGDKSDTNRLIDKIMSDEIIVDDEEHFVLHPDELALGMTVESVEIPAHYVGWLDGRSTLGRLGLMVHITAHRIDPGWAGNIVLEFYNAGKLPIVMRPGIAICAISFETMSSPAIRPYNSRINATYRNQKGPDKSSMGTNS